MHVAASPAAFKDATGVFATALLSSRTKSGALGGRALPYTSPYKLVGVAPCPGTTGQERDRSRQSKFGCVAVLVRMFGGGLLGAFCKLCGLCSLVSGLLFGLFLGCLLAVLGLRFGFAFWCFWGAFGLFLGCLWRAVFRLCGAVLGLCFLLFFGRLGSVLVVIFDGEIRCVTFRNFLL